MPLVKYGGVPFPNTSAGRRIYFARIIFNFHGQPLERRKIPYLCGLKNGRVPQKT
jgi:hypothetical protein